jgi:hypothetical protein
MRRSIVAPRDTLEMPRVRDGGRHDIPWDAELPALDADRRRRLASAWRWRMEQEHLAVGAFSLLAVELARVGCHSVVLSLVTRAAADEVRHADICRRLAEIHGGAPILGQLSGVHGFPDFEGASPEDAALYHIVEMCCLSETFTGVYFTEMLDRTTHPLGHTAVQSLLEDEIDHGRVGWAHLAAVRRAGGGASLSRVLPELVRMTVKPVMDDARRAPEGDDAVIDAHGYLGRDRGAAIYAETLFEVIFPGFEALGVDTEGARAVARDEGWR